QSSAFQPMSFRVLMAPDNGVSRKAGPFNALRTPLPLFLAFENEQVGGLRDHIVADGIVQVPDGRRIRLGAAQMEANIAARTPRERPYAMASQLLPVNAQRGIGRNSIGISSDAQL